MSTEIVETELMRFLASEDPEVLLIGGDWGVGKSFTWSRVLTRAKVDQKIALKRYAYVSLFGVGSAAELKQAIFENTILASKIGEKLDLASLESAGRKRAKVASILARSIPVLGALSDYASAFFFQAVRDQIICIDDLERRGGTLEVRDVFGLVSFLREQRNCKIVFLSNTGVLEGEDQRQFDDYLEKVVDAVVAFRPSATYCVTVAFDGDDTDLAARCIALEISNIRVLKKIQRLVRNVRPLLASYDAAVFGQAVHTLALLGWVKFSKNSPPIDFFKGRRSRSMMRAIHADKEQGPDAQTVAWDSLLDRYKFHGLDEFDEVLWQGVQDGYFDAGRLQVEAATLSKARSVQQGGDAQRRAWRAFHDSFDEDENTVVDSIFNTLHENMEHVTRLTYQARCIC